MKNLIIILLAVGVIVATVFAFNLNKAKTQQIQANDVSAKQLDSLQIQLAYQTVNLFELSNQVDELKVKLSNQTKASSAEKAANAAKNAQALLTEQNANADLQSVIDGQDKLLAKAKTAIEKLLPEAKRARTLPVIIQTRKALTGAGYVLVLRNETERPFEIKIHAASSTFDRSRDFNRVLPIRVPLQIGILQGWDFAPGDTVQITAAGYDAENFTFN